MSVSCLGIDCVLDQIYDSRGESENAILISEYSSCSSSSSSSSATEGSAASDPAETFPGLESPEKVVVTAVVDSKKRKKKKKKKKKKTEVPPAKLISGTPGEVSMKIASKNGHTKRPTVMATLRRVGREGGGYSKRKVLIDTGASRSAITTDVALDILKLKPRGTTNVTTGDGNVSKRLVVHCCIQVGNTVSNVWCTVRPPNAIRHCILGVDWLGLTKPSWYYSEASRSRKLIRRRKTAGGSHQTSSTMKRNSVPRSSGVFKFLFFFF